MSSMRRWFTGLSDNDDGDDDDDGGGDDDGEGMDGTQKWKWGVDDKIGLPLTSSQLPQPVRPDWENFLTSW